ncbi:YbjQ family protein [Rhodobacter maris]|uniref:UPF0145 protein SAMN05877831_11831 n=1 Tax=Rhodobacter maris TaxID=446682 RepID=A0A285TGZ8_9RHOB|nr:YbjQ family protein [Rhodobacter maris]SOC19658.1 uncharacterized protein YbjQ (UPF0145 family) [Rhodobacter maris]
MAICAGCGEKVSRFDLFHGYCPACYDAKRKKDGAERAATEEREQLAAMERQARLARIILTTETAHDLPVVERLGIVTAEYVVGLNIFRDIAAAFRDTFGGRSETMQRGLREAREAALDDLRAQAVQLGADAVVAVDLDYSEISGGGKSMLFLVASGTAVKLSQV